MPQLAKKICMEKTNSDGNENMGMPKDPQWNRVIKPNNENGVVIDDQMEQVKFHLQVSV